jgi:hypothetical protein
MLHFDKKGGMRENNHYKWADEMNRSEMQGRFLEMLICSPPHHHRFKEIRSD